MERRPTAPSTERLLGLLATSDRTALVGDIRDRLSRSIEQVLAVAPNLLFTARLIDGAHDNRTQIDRATSLQVQTLDFREHLVALMADHHGAQTLDIVPDPHTTPGVHVWAVEVDLYLASQVVVSAATNAQRLDAWQQLRTAVQLYASAVERVETYARSVRDALGQGNT